VFDDLHCGAGRVRGGVCVSRPSSRRGHDGIEPTHEVRGEQRIGHLVCLLGRRAGRVLFRRVTVTGLRRRVIALASSAIVRSNCWTRSVLSSGIGPISGVACDAEPTARAVSACFGRSGLSRSSISLTKRFGSNVLYRTTSATTSVVATAVDNATSTHRLRRLVSTTLLGLIFG
jgi:hypothetical protein